MSRKHFVGLLVVVLLACGCSRKRSEPACPVVDRGGGDIPELRAAKLPGVAIKLDGKLDEAAWQAAECSGGFVNPGSGSPEPGSRVNAAAWMAWDDTNLYVAVRVEDPEAKSPFTPAEVDPHVWEQSSGIELMLQPGDPGDNREYFEVQIDVAGARWTTSFDDYNDPIIDGPGGKRFGHQEWEPEIVAGVAVEASAGRYTVEFALPWQDVKSTRFPVPPRPGDIWRMNLYSFRDGQAEALAWSPILGEGNFHRASRFGRVIFEE